MIRRISGLIVLFCICVSSLSAKENTPMETFIRNMKENSKFTTVSNLWSPDNNFDKTALLKIVEQAQPLILDYGQVAVFMQQKMQAISLVLPGVNGSTYTIELARYDFLSNDFQVHAVGDNQDVVFDYTPGLYYRGIVNGIPGSVAAFSFFNNEVYGLFSIPGEGNYTVVPNTMVGEYYNSNPNYILYNDNHLKIKNNAPGCGTDDLPEIRESEAAAKTTTILNNNVYNNCKDVRVFEVGDYALYLNRGSSVSNVTNYMTAIFNNQSTVYRNEGIPIVLKYLQVNTATDAYQTIGSASSSLFLQKFGQVTQNTMHGCDVALLFSTRFGGMGGVAWLRSMCSSYSASSAYGPYGFCNVSNSAVPTFPTYSWNVMVSTHEMGHMVGSPHTHNCCWNPPARTTAIDGCYTLQGSCPMPSPQYPSGGGTIMSYCHLTSTGINLSNGFGPQPGDTIRRFVNFSASSCGAQYNPSTALTTVNKSITANRECTDLTSGRTYYWNDRNTADHTDDTLVLIVAKNGNNIGNMNTTGFSVTAGTLPVFGGGTGFNTVFPAGTPGTSGTNISMRRFWKITPTATPSSAVDVIFPFTDADTTDVRGSVPNMAPIENYKMYKVNSPVDPNPANGFSGAIASNFSVYTYGGTASSTNWSLSRVGTTNFAHMKMTNLSGGGTGFYSFGGVSVENMNGANAAVYVYPNPAHDKWYISVSKNNDRDLQFQLYTVDGKVALRQVLQSDSINSIDAGNLPMGVYFYRIIGGSNVYTGNLLKN